MLQLCTEYTICSINIKMKFKPITNYPQFIMIQKFFIICCSDCVSNKVRITGDLCVNGQTVQPDSLTSQSAYVQQDDLFIGLLTVREQLIFQAMLRMDRHITKAQRYDCELFS